MRQLDPSGNPIVKLLVGDDGKPMRSLDAERLLASVTRDVGRTLGGGMQSYEVQRGAAQQVLPQPPVQRPSLDGFVRQPAQPQQKPAAKPPIDSFFQR